MKSRFASAMRKAAATTRAFNPMAATRLIQHALSGRSSIATGLEASQRANEASPNVIRSSFDKRSFTCAAGTRNYKLYIPDIEAEAITGLVIMLHGCTQNPDDFAKGTRMNDIAAREGLLVAYPAQTRSHNGSGCWNWFHQRDQFRDKGEPSILAGITRELMMEFGLTRKQVFVAGLSAGGAMAVIMAETYPDVFSSVGVHSGLPYQSAGNAITAMKAMQGHSSKRTEATQRVSRTSPVRTIVFHGSADRTVHPSNAKGIVDDVKRHDAKLNALIQSGNENGRKYMCETLTDTNGRIALENWHIEGAGHAWSGGSRNGTFTDPTGPDASAEMVRFFLADARPA
jgi:poly(hydroxyalkanoate) depolymerase family esterase